MRCIIKAHFLWFLLGSLELFQELLVSVEADHEFPEHFRFVHSRHPADALHAAHARVLHFLEPLLLLLHRVRLELVDQRLVQWGQDLAGLGDAALWVQLAHLRQNAVAGHLERVVVCQRQVARLADVVVIRHAADHQIQERVRVRPQALEAPVHRRVQTLVRGSPDHKGVVHNLLEGPQHDLPEVLLVELRPLVQQRQGRGQQPALLHHSQVAVQQHTQQQDRRPLHLGVWVADSGQEVGDGGLEDLLRAGREPPVVDGVPEGADAHLAHVGGLPAGSPDLERVHQRRHDLLRPEDRHVAKALGAHDPQRLLVRLAEAEEGLLDPPKVILRQLARRIALG
mmetsp:Transcript_4701/g.11923  ORF Transcript_4701/g.11923 Transcript_4701/m.11923 type:complete len:340 (+) Transcript_4701:414-1433(+)